MPDYFPNPEEYAFASILRGENFSYQIAYHSDERICVKILAETDLDVKLYDVECIPSGQQPLNPDKKDKNYLAESEL